MRALLAYYFSGWIPRLFIGKREFAELWGFSRYLIAMQALNYAGNNLDKFLIGKYLGADTLGAYRYGDKIASLPQLLVNRIIGRVLFPAFSSYQDNKARIKYQYLKAIRLVSSVTFPLMLGICIASDHIVLTLLGNKWSEMVVILPILTLSYIFTTVGVLNLNIYKALGRTKRLFKIGIVFRLNLLLCMFIGIKYGLVGLLVGLMLARFINFFPALYIAGLLINTSLKDVLVNTYKVFISCGIMAAVIYAGEYIFALVPGDLVSLVIVVALGAASYLFASLLIQRQTISDIVNMSRASG